MKRKILFLLVMMALLACVLVISVSAAETTVGEVTYTLTQGATPEENTAVVNSHKSKTFTTTDITIPVSVEYEGEVYYVTALHSEAFRATNLTSITFEAGSRIEEIGNYCFYGSSKLTTVILPDNLKYIRGEAFRGCSVLTALYLPDTVESMGFYENGSANTGSGSGTFAGCSKLFFVNELGETTKPAEWRAPSALREISGEIFKERGSLSTTIIFGENFTYLGNAFAFAKLSAINKVRRTFIFEGDFTSEGARFEYSCETNNLNMHFTNPNITTVDFLKFHTAWANVTISNTSAYVYGANKKALLTNQKTADAETLDWVDIYRNSRVVVNTPNGEKEMWIYDTELFEISRDFEITAIKSFADPDDPSITYTSSDIVKLYINSTSTSILKGAKFVLPNLKEIILEEGAYITINENVFTSGNCPKLERLDMRLGSVVFKNKAFSGFSQIKELLLSANTYEFGDETFKNAGLTSLTIPHGANVKFGKASFTGTKIRNLYIGNVTGDTSLKNTNATFDGILTLETVVLMNINQLGEWAFSVGDSAVPEYDLTVYCHSTDLTLHANAFNNRKNGGHKVFLYTLDNELNVTAFNNSSYTVYAGIPHAFEFKELTSSTCVENGTAQYVAKDCTCDADYRSNTFITYSNIDTGINGVTQEAYGTEVIYLELAPHTQSDNIIGIVYLNGFTSKAAAIYECSVCYGVSHRDSTPTVEAMFVCNGYSIPEYGEYKSITQGFSVNQEVLELYNSFCEQGEELRYGIVAGVQSVLGENVEIFENGELIPDLPVAAYECSGYSYSHFEIKVTGLEKGTESISYAELPIYCCAYVLAYDGDEVVSGYITSSLNGRPIEGDVLSNPYSYNDILANIELMKQQYVGYDGYIWIGDQRTEEKSVVFEDDVVENTLELYDTPFFSVSTLDAGTKAVLMNNYFSYAKATPYSSAMVAELTTYVSNDGLLDIGRINLVTGEYSLIKTVSVVSGENTVALGVKLGANETLVLGGSNTTVNLYTVSGVEAEDEYGAYTTDTSSFAISNTNGVNDKLIVNVKLQLTYQEDACLTPEREEIYADRTSGYKEVVLSVAPFIYTDADMFEGKTLKSMKLFVTKVTYTDGYATMKIGVFTVSDNFGSGMAAPSYNEVYEIRVPAEFFGSATTVNAWYEIDLTKYAYKSDGTQATEGIVVGDGETIALTAKKDDKIVWGFNDKIFSDVDACEEFYYTSSGNLAISSSNSVLNFLFYYENTVSIGSVQEHINSLRELDKEAYVKAELSGKKLSILGDSISTYKGVSNDSAQGLSQNAVFYSSQIQQADTYWYQLLEMFGMELCVNNSWSGAYATVHKPNNNAGYDSDGSVSSGVARADNLANVDDTVPDYIIVFIGINDLEANVAADVLAEAYNEMLRIISETYPKAKVFCINMPSRTGEASPADYNVAIKNAVDSYDNAYLVDLCGSEYKDDVFKTNSLDNLHPNAIGMDYLTDLVAEAMEAVIVNQYE